MGPLAKIIGSDCGEACVLTALYFCGVPVASLLTVDDLVRAHSNYNGYTTAKELVALGLKYGLNLVQSAAGQNHSIHLIHYGKLPDRLRRDSGFKAGHWIWVLVMTNDGCWFHDPYHPGTSGSFKFMTLSEYNRCYAGVCLRAGC